MAFEIKSSAPSVSTSASTPNTSPGKPDAAAKDLERQALAMRKAVETAAPFVRATAAATAGASLALATPVALGISALASGYGALRNGINLAQSLSGGNWRSCSPWEGFCVTFLTSAVCMGSAVGTGVSALALPLTVPAAAVAGVALDRSSPFPAMVLVRAFGFSEWILEKLGYAVPPRPQPWAKAAPARATQYGVIPAPAERGTTQQSIPVPAKKVPASASAKFPEPSVVVTPSRI